MTILYFLTCFLTGGVVCGQKVRDLQARKCLQICPEGGTRGIVKLTQNCLPRLSWTDLLSVCQIALKWPACPVSCDTIPLQKKAHSTITIRGLHAFIRLFVTEFACGSQRVLSFQLLQHGLEVKQNEAAAQ